MKMGSRAWQCVLAALVAMAAVAAVAAQSADDTKTVSMKVLVLGTVADTDATLGGIFGALRARGSPFDYINVRQGYANNEPLPLVDAGGRGNYYAVVKMSRNLAYEAQPGFWPSALSESQWAQLDAYLAEYSVRAMSVHSWPFFSGATFHSGGATGFMQYTGLHQQLDAALAPDARISLTGSYVTPANLDTATEFEATAFLYATEETPTPNGVAAAIHTDPVTSVETWHFFFIPTPYYAGQVAAMQVAVNWITRGVYLGQRRLYLSMQVDDIFLATGEWGVEFADDDDQSKRPQVRVNAAELQLLKDSQEWLTDKLPDGSLIKYEWAFNGEGVVDNGGCEADSLCTQARVNVDDFWWVTHTYSHPYLDNYTFAECSAELSQNWDSARTIWGDASDNLPDSVGQHEMVNPAITGLFNAECLRAMQAQGINTVVGDNSRAELLPDDVYHGLYTTVAHNGYDGIFIIPRWATNIFFDNSRPETNLVHFNYITPYSWTWEQLMEYESTTAARNLIQNRPDPYMFHQGNAAGFPWPDFPRPGNASLLTIWANGVIDELNKYNAFPVRSLQQKDMRTKLEERMARDACGIDAYMVVEHGTATRIHATSTATCTLAVSGIPGALLLRDETYGSQWGGERTVYADLTPGNEVVIDTGLNPAPTCPIVGGVLCSGNGYCDSATSPPTCVCDTGYSGDDCSVVTVSWLGNRLTNGDFQDGDATTAPPWGTFGSGFSAATAADGSNRYITMTNADASGTSGAYQFLTLGQESATAIRIQADSRPMGVSGVQDANYAVYVDAVYDDGTWQYGLTGQFDPTAGDGEWHSASVTFTPTKPVAHLWVYCMFRNHAGTADFDNVAVQEAAELFSATAISTDGRCGANSPTNAACPASSCCSTYGWCGTGVEHCTYTGSGDDASSSSSSSSSSSDTSGSSSGVSQTCDTCTAGSGPCKHPDGWCAALNALGDCPAGMVPCADASAFSTSSGGYVVLTLAVDGIQPQAFTPSIQSRFEESVAAAVSVPSDHVGTAYIADPTNGATKSSQVQLVVVAANGQSGADVSAVAQAAAANGALDNELAAHSVGVHAEVSSEPRVVASSESGSGGFSIGLMLAAAAVACVLGIALGAIAFRRNRQSTPALSNSVTRLDRDDRALWSNNGHVRVPQHSDSGRRANATVSDSEVSDYSSAVEGMDRRRVSQRQLIYSRNAAGVGRPASAASAASYEEPQLIGTPRSSLTGATDVRAPVLTTSQRVADV